MQFASISSPQCLFAWDHRETSSRKEHYLPVRISVEKHLLYLDCLHEATTHLLRSLSVCNTSILPLEVRLWCSCASLFGELQHSWRRRQTTSSPEGALSFNGVVLYRRLTSYRTTRRHESTTTPSTCSHWGSFASRWASVRRGPSSARRYASWFTTGAISSSQLISSSSGRTCWRTSYRYVEVSLQSVTFLAKCTKFIKAGACARVLLLVFISVQHRERVRCRNSIEMWGFLAHFSAVVKIPVLSVRVSLVSYLPAQ